MVKVVFFSLIFQDVCVCVCVCVCVFQKFDSDVSWYRFLWVYPVGFTEFLESVGLCLLPNLRNSAIIYLILSQFHLFFFLWDSNGMNVRFFFFNSPQVSVAPFIFFFQCIFFLFFRLSSFCYSILSSLFLSFGPSILLLSPFTEFLVSLIVFFSLIFPFHSSLNFLFLWWRFIFFSFISKTFIIAHWSILKIMPV